MNVGIIILIIVIIVAVLTGIGVGLYFLLRKTSPAPGPGPTPGPTPNPGCTGLGCTGVTGTSPCDILFNNVISQPTFNEAALAANNGIFSLPKDANNNITGCDNEDIATQLLSYARGYNLSCNDFVLALVAGPNNCKTAYATIINRYPAYSSTCSAGAQKFISLWATGNCP
jgi:hypothetical protein